MTLRQIHEAASCFGATIDDVLEDPTCLRNLSLGAAGHFVSLLLGEDLMEMPMEQAHATTARACSFFIEEMNGVLKRANERMEPIWKRCGVPASKGSMTMLRALAYSSFTDYQALLDAPAEDALMYLSLRSLNAALEK